MTTTIINHYFDSKSLIIKLRFLQKQLQIMLDKRHQRKQLATLTIDQLIDMGIDPADAQLEICKPFWK